MFMILADRIVLGEWRGDFEKAAAEEIIEFTAGLQEGVHAVELFFDRGVIAAYLCESAPDTCEIENSVMYWKNVTIRSVFDFEAEAGLNYTLKIIALKAPMHLVINIVQHESIEPIKLEPSEPIIPNRFHVPHVTEQQFNETLISHVIETSKELNVNFNDISRETPSEAGFSRTLYPVMFIRSYLKDACYETSVEQPAFFEVLYEKPVRPKYLIVGHPRFSESEKDAPRTIWVSYIRIAREGIELRDLRPFEYAIDGPVEEIFRLEDFGLDEEDDVVRIKVTYDGYAESVCAYYFGIYGKTQDEPIEEIPYQ